MWTILVLIITVVNRAVFRDKEDDAVIPIATLFESAYV